jgi:hypothetical protein
MLRLIQLQEEGIERIGGAQTKKKDNNITSFFSMRAQRIGNDQKGRKNEKNFVIK